MSDGQSKDQATSSTIVTGGKSDMIVQPRDQAALGAVFGNVIGKELHNFEGAPREQWAFKAKCCGPSVAALEDTLGKPIDIVYYYGMLYDHIEPNDGQIEERLRFVLVDANGNAYKTASFYVAREIGRAVAAMGNAPFDPPLRMRLVKGKGRQKGEFFTLEPVFDG